MAKPPGFEEPYKSPNLDLEKETEEHGANPKATKAVYVIIGIVLVVLFLLIAVGLHIPAGG